MKLGEALLKAKNTRLTCAVTVKDGDYKVVELNPATAFIFVAGKGMPIPCGREQQSQLDALFNDAMSGRLARVPGKAIKRRKV